MKNKNDKINVNMDRPISPVEIRKRRIKIALSVVLGVAVLVGAVLWISGQLQTGVKQTSLVFYTVDSGTIETGVSAYGKVVPAFEERITSPVGSRIMEVYARVGDTVEVGTPLLRLDLQSIENDYKKLLDEEKMKCYQLEQQLGNDKIYLNDLDMQIRIAEMKLDRMKVDWSNERYLDSLGSGTADQVRQAELSYTTSRMELEQLRQKVENERQARRTELKIKQLDLEIFRRAMEEKRRTLEDARIRSPRRAVLTFVNTQIGAQVSQGEEVAVVSDLSHFRIEGSLSDTYADLIRVGAKVLVKVNDQVFPGMVSGVTPLSDNGMISFSVQLDDKVSSRLRPGVKADLYVVHAVRENAMRMANASFYTGPGEYQLFVQDGDELVRRRVRLGECDFDHVEVLDGLKEGERVVVSDLSSYKDKMVLKIR